MDTIHSVLTVSGAAAIVASIVQVTEFPLDRFSPVTSNRLKRLYVFLVSFLLVSFEVYRRLGYHSNGDLLGLGALAGTVAGAAIVGWNLLNGRLGTQSSFQILQGSPPAASSTEPGRNVSPIS